MLVVLKFELASNSKNEMDKYVVQYKKLKLHKIFKDTHTHTHA